MESEEFIRKVRDSYNAEDLNDARILTEAVLETMGERLPEHHREHIAAQLNGNVKEYILKRPEARPFTLEAFYNRAGGRAGLRYTDAVRACKTVINVLGEAVAEGEMADIAAALPGEYKELFGARALETTIGGSYRKSRG